MSCGPKLIELALESTDYITLSFKDYYYIIIIIIIINEICSQVSTITMSAVRTYTVEATRAASPQSPTRNCGW